MSPAAGHGPAPQLQREIEYHEKLYSGFAQSHFAKPAVRALREHMVRRILKLTGAGKSAQVLSLGCGIGDTELLLAPHVGELTGLDLSPSAIRQARLDAAGVANLQFIDGTWECAQIGPASCDVVIAIFFLHHLPDTVPELASQVATILKPGGVFYSLDPSRYPIVGNAIGELLFPKLMARYQSPNERCFGRRIDGGSIFARLVSTRGLNITTLFPRRWRGCFRGGDLDIGRRASSMKRWCGRLCLSGRVAISKWWRVNGKLGMSDAG